MNLLEFEENLHKNIERQLINPRVILDKFRLINENSRKSSPYQDPFYLPFYYHLGKYISPNSLLEFGFRLGLASGCFLKSCKTVNNFLGFERKAGQFYSPRLALANIRDVMDGQVDAYVGHVTDDEFIDRIKCGWDLIFVNEQETYDNLRETLHVAWNYLNFDGLLVMDYVNSLNSAKDAFSSFCKVANREPMFFKTRYGTGIIEK